MRWLGPVVIAAASACQPRPPQLPPGSADTGTSTGSDDAGADSGDGACEGMICAADLPPDSPPRCEPPGRSGRHHTCSTVGQDCPPGDKCSIWGVAGSEVDTWGPTRCVPEPAGAVLVGKPCTVPALDNLGCDDCVAGALCWNVDEQVVTGRCVAFCAGQVYDPLCADTTTCVGRDGWVFDICLPRCDPLMQACDDHGEACYLIDDQFVCFPEDRLADFGEPCTKSESCRPGLACVPVDAVPDCAGTDGCCSPYCDTTEADPCLPFHADLDCISVYEVGVAPEGYEHVGTCRSPG